MGDESKIEWTDATWNPVRGCVKVSPGCKNCYAETFAERWRGLPGHPYEQGFDLRLVPEKLKDPINWKRPRRIFVNSMSDLFQVGVPDEYVDQVFAVMALSRQHTFQVLTKRADRMRDYLVNRSKSAKYWKAAARTFGYALEFGDVSLVPFPLPNVWLGVSVENNYWKSRVIPHLVSTPAAVRFVSIEPLLEDLGDISDWFPREREVSQTQSVWIDGVNWVIVGGESGAGARPFDVQWGRSIVKQCQAAGVPVFVKQLGAKPEIQQGCGDCDPCVAGQRCSLGYNVGMGLKNHKGGDMAEWPADLRIRQFPEMKGKHA